MKKHQITMLCCLLIGTFTHLKAATPFSELWGLRFAAGIDYSPVNNLKLFASEEFRLGDYDILDCSYTEIGASYKILPFLETGLSYTAIINIKGDEGVALNEMNYKTDIRHRGTFDLTLSWKPGQWKFSLRERVQATYKAKNINNFQQPQTTWVLRSRLKAAYTSRRLPLEPYIYFEPRLLLNGATWTENATSETMFMNADFLNYNDVYFNRYRFSIGTEWQLTAQNSLDIYVIYDYLNEKEIDAYKEGGPLDGILKMPITTSHNHYLAVGIAYTFSL